jgi:large subunit ribosomal protein L23
VQKGKVKAFRGRIGRRKDMKKAMVTLLEGQNIDLMGV